MWTIEKRWHFSASHVLEGLPDGHQCGRLHGHNYEVHLSIRSTTLDRVGFVVDFGELKPVGDWLSETFDHRHLNDAMPGNPTSEHLARFIAGHARLLLKDVLPSGADVLVTVSETPRSFCTYESRGSS